LWLAETSQQPISQTTRLKVTPHCNHAYSYANVTPCYEEKPLCTIHFSLLHTSVSCFL
jgi:hypothetical protein